MVLTHVEPPAAPPVRERDAPADGHGAEQAVRQGARHTDRERLQRQPPPLGRLSRSRGSLRGVEEGLEHQGD